MTKTEIKSHTATLVRTYKLRLEIADGIERHTIVAEIESFLTKPGATLLSDGQRRNLARMISRARTRTREETRP